MGESQFGHQFFPFGMHPRTLYELRAWLNVIGGAVIFIGWVLFYHDHNTSPVQWCAGRVVGKHRAALGNRNDHSLFTPNSYNYYIDVDVDGKVGSVLVNDFSYNDWPAGTACEVASRHGRLTDYTFEDIRLRGR